ncbi:ABC transporter permease subunit [Oxalobacteraceae bacterium CAVE-383]|nr:ABC transporter permease subunit [Oxalobacteraceae bacterium CAVE-383]
MRLRKEPFISFVALVAVWEVTAHFFPPFLFPSTLTIGKEILVILGDPKQVVSAIATALRILAGMAGAFVAGGLIGVWMGMSPRVERYVHPLLTFNQGIPALSWVVFSVIWFKSTEFRIWFIIAMTTLPAFAFQIYDSYRAMSKDLVEMTLSFRPSRWDKFRTLIVPSILPGIATAWKVNLGNVARVVVVAELVGATVGVGFELLQRQQLFDMAGAMAWTMVLVLFVVVSQGVVTLLETSLLRYRAQSERGL